jgi:endonuclease I
VVVHREAEQHDEQNSGSQATMNPSCCWNSATSTPYAAPTLRVQDDRLIVDHQRAERHEQQEERRAEHEGEHDRVVALQARV